VRFLQANRHPHRSKALARGQNHDDLPSLEFGVLLDLGKLGDVGLDLVQQLGADLLVRHLTATITQRDLDLVMARILTS
jgi:hypothetical protein